MTDEKKPKATFRTMTLDEQALAKALKGGSFIVGKLIHFDKQFAQDMRERAERSKPEISEKQAEMLRKLITKHRKKIDPKAIPEAERHLLNEPAAKARGRWREPTIAEDMQLSAAKSERDEWERRAKDFQLERDQARRELVEARHQLDMVREENADIRRQQLKLGELSSSGLLWLINRVVFHPRGFALALSVESDGRIIGWSLQGNGEEIWKFSDADDDTGFAAAEATLKAAAKANAQPAAPSTQEPGGAS